MPTRIGRCRSAGIHANVADRRLARKSAKYHPVWHILRPANRMAASGNGETGFPVTDSHRDTLAGRMRLRHMGPELLKSRTCCYLLRITLDKRHHGANANSTFPGNPPKREYPELTNNIPPTTTAPGPSIDPPLALIPFTVGNSRAVSKSQITLPSSAL